MLPENNDVHVSIDVNEETVPDIKLPSSEENNSQDIILPKINTDEPPSFALNANVADKKEDSIEISVTNTQKTLNNLRKEWEEMKKSSLENSVEDELPKVVNSEETLSYPFGGWTDENNYNK